MMNWLKENKKLPKLQSTSLEEKNSTGLPLPIEEWLIKKQMRDYLGYINRSLKICIFLIFGVLILGIIALIHFW